MQILQKRNVAGMDGPADEGKHSRMDEVAAAAWSLSVAGARGGSEAEEEHSGSATARVDNVAAVAWSLSVAGSEVEEEHSPTARVDVASLLAAGAELSSSSGNAAAAMAEDMITS